MATQYYDGAGKIAYSASNGGSAVDTDPYPSTGCVSTSGGPCISDAQLQTEIAKVVAAHGWPTGMNTMYFVYFPPNVTTCTDVTSTQCSGTVYCAYHSSVGSGSSTILYANMPYDGVSGCESGESPNGNTAADSELNVTSHENIEAITDPLGTAWYDSSGQEIGDKCNFTVRLGAGRRTRCRVQRSRSQAVTTTCRRSGVTPALGLRAAPVARADAHAARRPVTRRAGRRRRLPVSRPGRGRPRA